eukprot:14997965-Alexandrium_andersonii.AAC.1
MVGDGTESRSITHEPRLLGRTRKKWPDTSRSHKQSERASASESVRERGGNFRGRSHGHT